MTGGWDDSRPHDPLNILDGPPFTLRPPARCWCGRGVSWDGVFCAEHDDGPDPLADSISRHPAGKARTEDGAA